MIVEKQQEQPTISDEWSTLYILTDTNIQFVEQHVIGHQVVAIDHFLFSHCLWNNSLGLTIMIGMVHSNEKDNVDSDWLCVSMMHHDGQSSTVTFARTHLFSKMGSCWWGTEWVQKSTHDNLHHQKPIMNNHWSPLINTTDYYDNQPSLSITTHHQYHDNLPHHNFLIIITGK